MDFVLRPLRAINRVIEIVTAATSTFIAFVMVAALTLSAVTRYVSGTGYDWFIELPPALVPWMVFPLLGPLLRTDSHIRVKFLPSLLEGHSLILLKIVVFAIMLTGAIIFFLAGNEAVSLYRKLGQMMELEIEIPIWWMYLAFPTGFAILALFSLELLLESIRNLIVLKREAEK